MKKNRSIIRSRLSVLSALVMFILFGLSACKIQTIRIVEAGIKKEYQQLRKSGLQEGSYKEYYPSGKLFVEKQFENGLQCGKELQYFESGNLKASFTLHAGVYDGPFTYYHPNGHILQEGMYVTDNIEGKLLSYYKNGQLKESVTMKETVENGSFIEYFENGQLKAKGNYLDGKEHCFLEMYSEEVSGQLLSKKLCRNGQCCTYWGADKGAVSATHELCREILEEMRLICTECQNN